MSAQLCRLLRDEVSEQLALGSEALTALAVDWRKLLFPDATDERFADGYAQAVTFGMLMARAKGISLAASFDTVARELDKTSTLIGAALRLLTDNAENQATLKTSLGTLKRVLDAVHWPTISKGDPEAWLYFYEDFLEIYDNALRKQTGSYYTPPEVVGAMVQLVDEALRSQRFNLPTGIAARAVTVADPATGTGTFLLGTLRKVAEIVRELEGPGSISAAVDDAVRRLIAFEIQLGPFAVAQLRVLAEIVELTGHQPKTPIRMFVTNTLGNPDDDEGWIPGILAPIAKSRRDANKVKREEPITVVIGNPPYKEKAKGQGSWIEGEKADTAKSAPLADWIPPPDWGIGAHAKHLRNLYIYFWRWATWKVFDHDAAHNSGIVCFITVAGFLGGPGFQRMREYLRRTCDDIWVIDCSPEGHQPGVNTRIFQGVQQPVCIVLASRSTKSKAGEPAHVWFHALPAGHRHSKFEALGKLSLTGTSWNNCPSDWRSPFLPASTGSWSTYPALESLFVYNGSGVMPGRTWIIAPDVESLRLRWQKLTHAKGDQKELLFHPHAPKGELGDRHTNKVLKEGLPGLPARTVAVANDRGAVLEPVRYAFRSFDRQWIIPDNRLINRPNPSLWAGRSQEQLFITAPSDRSPTNGPALTVTAFIPDLHHYNGRGGRAFPLWGDPDAREPNLRPSLTSFLSDRFGIEIRAEDAFAYIIGIASHTAFTSRFLQDLSTPGLRIPFASGQELFMEVVEVGRTVVWLQTFGERMTDFKRGRPARPPRLPADRRPRVPTKGAIPQDPSAMSDVMDFDDASRTLRVGTGHIENVSPEVWAYQVSGKHVLSQWFSYRKANRERPIIGDRRPPSPLGEIQPNHWLAEYTTELIDVLNVLGLLIEQEPIQAKLLDQVCSGETISAEELEAAGALKDMDRRPFKLRASVGIDLFGRLRR